MVCSCSLMHSAAQHPGRVPVRTTRQAESSVRPGRLPAAGTTKHRTVAPASEPVPAGVGVPAAHNGAARVPGPAVTAHPGAARPHVGATGPVTAHAGDGTANV